MPALKICLLGDVTLQAATSGPLHFPTKKSKSLFAYLAVHSERTFTRAVTAGEFWPESDERRAQRCLNTEIWRLRTMLKGSGIEPDEFLQSDHDSIGFRRDADHWIDAAEFDSLTQAVGRCSAQRTYLELFPGLVKAVALYRGDFAEGLFDEWCLVQREAYRARLMAALEALLATAMEARRWEDAIAFGRRLLQLDPLQEHVHRALMRCHVSLGNRPGALRQYATCETILRNELQIEPMEETRQLFSALVAGEVHSRSAEPFDGGRSGTPGSCTPAQRIDLALANLSKIQASLEHASRELRQEPIS
jgi:DNA-binding SARP family transcriptional activator